MKAINLLAIAWFSFGEEIIKIVSSLPMQGSAQVQTLTVVNGIKMAFEEVNYKVGNFKIVYEAWDDATATSGKWDAAKENENAIKAVQDKDIMAYIGTYNSGAAKISMPILNRAGLLMISPANSYPGLTKPGKGEPSEPYIYRPRGKINYFRVVPADDIQGVVAAEWAKQMQVKSVYILHDKELYGKGIADVFEKHARKIGIKVLGYEGIDIKAQDYRALMTKIKARNPDLVYFGGTTQTKAGQLANDMRAVGLKCKYMVPDGCFEEAFLKSANPDNLNDLTFITFGGLPPSKLTGKGAEFYKKYKEKYKSEPEAYAVYGYEVGRVLIEIIKRANKKDREAFIEAAKSIKNFDGVLGKWSFDENGDTTLTIMSGNTVKNGRFEFVKILKAGK